MTTFIILLCIALLLLIIVQVARVRDLAKKLRGSEEIEAKATASTGRGLMVFMVALLVITTGSAYYYKNYILGFGPHASSSAHGEEIDSMMKWTLGVTYITYILTHIALFYYAYKYRSRKGRKARYMSHNNTVELVWTGIPAIVMTFLVVGGLDAWNEIMSDVREDEPYMEIEAMGYQFAWQMRYPGPDGLLGRRDFRLITGANPMGQDWTDPKNHDDILVNDVTLPVDQQVRVRITAKDVLHDFYLPQFRVKMDAVPGLPTYFVFTPTKTSKEYRESLSEYPEYQTIDPQSETGEQLWETRNYELACAELCGVGHWSMARTVNILEQDDFDAWYADQTSYYEANIKGTEDDPLFMAEVKEQRQGLNRQLTQVMETPGNEDNFVGLDQVTFEDGTAELAGGSSYQLDDVVAYLEKNEGVGVFVLGHSATGDDADADMSLSTERAEAIRSYLIEAGIDASRLRSRGYGASQLMNTSEGGAGRNAHIEMYITEGGVSEPRAADLSSK